MNSSDIVKSIRENVENIRERAQACADSGIIMGVAAGFASLAAWGKQASSTDLVYNVDFTGESGLGPQAHLFSLDQFNSNYQSAFDVVKEAFHTAFNTDAFRLLSEKAPGLQDIASQVNLESAQHVLDVAYAHASLGTASLVVGTVFSAAVVATGLATKKLMDMYANHIEETSVVFSELKS